MTKGRTRWGRGGSAWAAALAASLWLGALAPAGRARAMADPERRAVRSTAEAGRLEEALSLAEAAAAKDGDDPEAAGLVGAVLFRMDRRDEAVAGYRSFASAHPKTQERALEGLCAGALDLSTSAPDERVRTAAIESMEKTGLERWNESLHRAVLSDPNPELRQAAAHALRRVGGKRGRSLFREDLTSPDEGTRKLAADALVRMGDDSAEAFLKQELASDDLERRRWAAKQLVKLGDDVAIPAISADLSAEKREVRLATVRLLSELDSKGTIPVLRGALTDPDRDVRLAAAHALADKGDGSGVEPIREELRSGDTAEKLRALGAIEALGAKEAVPEMKLALADPNEKVQGAAAELLDEFGEPEGRKWMEQKESEGGGGILQKAAGIALLPLALAAKAVGQKPPEEKMDDPSRYVRAEAAREAAELSPAQGRPLLARGLEDKDPLVRRSTVWSIAEAGDRSLVPALIEAIRDPDPAVRLGACGAIVKLIGR